MNIIGDAYHRDPGTTFYVNYVCIQITEKLKETNIFHYYLQGKYLYHQVSGRKNSKYHQNLKVIEIQKRNQK